MIYHNLGKHSKNYTTIAVSMASMIKYPSIHLAKCRNLNTFFPILIEGVLRINMNCTLLKTSKNETELYYLMECFNIWNISKAKATKNCDKTTRF